MNGAVGAGKATVKSMGFTTGGFNNASTMASPSKLRNSSNENTFNAGGVTSSFKTPQRSAMKNSTRHNIGGNVD